MAIDRKSIGVADPFHFNMAPYYPRIRFRPEIEKIPTSFITFFLRLPKNIEEEKMRFLSIHGKKIFLYVIFSMIFG